MIGSSRLATFVGSADARRQLLRYLLVGAANTLFAYALYALGLLVGLPYELASLVAMVIGIIVSFVTQGRFVFLTRLEGRFLLFATAWAALYLINITLISVLHWAGLDYYFAGLVAAIPVTTMSFLLQRGIVFANPPLPVQRTVIIGLLLLLAAARLDLALRFEANWDEFLNLAMVHSYGRGELQEILQTAFVHLFRWLPVVSANEVDQVIAARLLVLLFAAVSSLAIYGIARRFMDLSAALVAVLAYNGFSFVMRNGNSVRSDPLASSCLMVGIWLAVAKNFGLRHALALGILVGLGGALTIKSFFYVPVIGMILLLQIWYAHNRRRAIGLAALSGLTALASFAVILALHANTFPATASASSFVARTSGATLVTGDYSIVLESMLAALSRNFAFWVLLVAGLAGAAATLRDPLQRRDGLTLLSLALVLASPLVYRDVYAYYYPFMLAPASVLVGYGFARLSGLRRDIYTYGAIALLFVASATTYLQSRAQDNSGQRRMLALVHQLFPEPVPYIDHTSMVSSYPKLGIFMSRWGITDYRHANTPIMADIIDQKEPRFLLATRHLLDVERIDPQVSESRSYSLLAEDIRALQANYLRYWGQLYLPGLRFEGDSVRQVQIPGRYTLVSTEPAIVDGREIVPGMVVALTKGEHRLFSSSPASLRWAAPPPPAEQPPRQLFRGF